MAIIITTGWLSVVVALLFNSQSTGAAYCSGKPDPYAQPNNKTIYNGQPTLLKTVENGKLFKVGEGDDDFYIVHVWGKPYDMGRAHGQLLQDRVVDMMDRVWKYLEDQITDAINGTVSIFKPQFLKEIADFGLDATLDLEADITNKYTGSYFIEEARGLANGSGADLKKILRIHMIGELTKGDCSMFGAWGKSLRNSNSLLQLRALDWSYDGPFKDFPQVTVYHPYDGHPFANFGWTGWIGSITGVSSTRLAISEIGVSFPDETFGKESRFGIPFTYLLRDILQFDVTIDDAINRIANSARTCNLILGVGDGKTNIFRGIEYSASVADFFDDKNLRPEAVWHPKISDIVYWGMDWNCPAYNEVLARQLHHHYGNITAQVVISDVVPIVQTGNLQVAVYDLTKNLAYLSNARASNETGPDFAYDRGFVQLNLTDLFAVKPPPY